MGSGQLNFTKAELQKLEPDQSGRRAYFRDSKERGLVLCVTGNGVKSFQVYRKVSGRPVRLTLGHFNPDLPDTREIPKDVDALKLLEQLPDLNVKMARMLASVVNVEFDRGNNPANIKRKARGELTLGTLFDRYIEDYAIPAGKKTVSDMRANFERYLGEIKDRERKSRGQEKTKPAGSVNWQNRKLTEISTGDVRQLHKGLAKNIGGHTANRTVEMLRALFRKAERWGEYKGENPAAAVDFADEPSRKRFIHGGELGPFFESLAAEPSEQIRDYVVLSLLTGARKANVMAMEWAHCRRRFNIDPPC